MQYLDIISHTNFHIHFTTTFHMLDYKRLQLLQNTTNCAEGYRANFDLNSFSDWPINWYEVAHQILYKVNYNIQHARLQTTVRHYKLTSSCFCIILVVEPWNVHSAWGHTRASYPCSNDLHWTWIGEQKKWRMLYYIAFWVKYPTHVWETLDYSSKLSLTTFDEIS